MPHHGDVHDNDRGNVIRFLLASDLHLGYLERDPVRGSDSFDALREILETAKNEAVDFILLGGDLFHENKPSRATMYKTISMLRQYCLGDKPVEIELLSDPFDAHAKVTSFPLVNYEDENLNVSLPVFLIHGNHDDPQGSGDTGPLSALDLLSTTGLANYFGKLELPSESSAKRKGTQDTLLHVRPILLRKGETRMALYGIGNIKDERLLYELESNHVCMYRPSENAEEWFNLLVIHQNRSGHTQRGFIPESVFDDNLDLIVWGHEHEQRILPEAVSEKNYYISQPGSSVATSLCRAETVEKRIGIVNVEHKDFKIDSIPLQNVRPLVMDDISLTEEIRSKGLDASSRVDITKLLREKINVLIQRAHKLWEDRMSTVASEQRRNEPLPLIRLRVAYDTHLPIGNVVRFGGEFVDQVANPKDIIQLQLKRSSRSRAAHTSVARLPINMAPAEKMERVQLPALVVENMKSQNLDLLDAKQLQQSVMSFVEKDEFLQKTLPQLESDLAARHLDEVQVQHELASVGARYSQSLQSQERETTDMESTDIAHVNAQQRDDRADSPDSFQESFSVNSSTSSNQAQSTRRSISRDKVLGDSRHIARATQAATESSAARTAPTQISQMSLPRSSRAAVLSQSKASRSKRRGGQNDVF